MIMSSRSKIVPCPLSTNSPYHSVRDSAERQTEHTDSHREGLIIPISMAVSGFYLCLCNLLVRLVRILPTQMPVNFPLVLYHLLQHTERLVHVMNSSSSSSSKCSFQMFAVRAFCDTMLCHAAKDAARRTCRISSKL